MMSQPDSQTIASLLTKDCGITLVGSLGSEYGGEQHIELCPDGGPKGSSFSVRLSLGLASVHGELILDSFSRPLIEKMGSAAETHKEVFAKLSEKMREKGGEVLMRVNGKSQDPAVPETWPKDWNRFELKFEKRPIDITENIQETEDTLVKWGGRFLLLILQLVPMKPLDFEEEDNPEGLPEGAKTLVKVNKYERNPHNRRLCLEIHGYACKACGFRFKEKYGDLGEGYIHVHHKTTVSEMGEGYIVDPIKDLVPLCPNCHAMVHRKEIPLTIEQLVDCMKSQ